MRGSLGFVEASASAAAAEGGGCGDGWELVVVLCRRTAGVSSATARGSAAAKV